MKNWKPKYFYMYTNILIAFQGTLLKVEKKKFKDKIETLLVICVVIH